MRRFTRRSLSILLILALLLALGLSAFAEGQIAGASEAPEAVPETPEDGELLGGISMTESAIRTLSAAPVAADCEIYVASYGSDDAPGTREAPLATLSAAAERASRAAADTVYVVLLTDLTAARTARFYNKDVVLLSDDAPCRVVRAAEFLADWDAVRGVYNPALIECGRVEGTGNAPARLTIENVVLDDFGAHGGTDFLEAAPEQDNSARVQDGILAAYNAGASLVLTDGTQLLNYGGLAAVYLDGGASLVMEDGSAICDTLDLPLPAGGGSILLRGGAAAELAQYATVVERAAPAQPESAAEPVEETEEPAAEPVEETEEPAAEPVEETEEPAAEPVEETEEPAAEPVEETEEPAAEPVEETEEPAAEPVEETEEPAAEPVEETEEPAAEPVEETGELTAAEEPELGGVLRGAAGGLELPSLSDAASLSFVSDPESLTLVEDGLFTYHPAYDLSLTLGDAVKTAMQLAASGVTGEGTITITLDSRLTVSLSGNPTLTSNVFAQNGDVTLSGSVLTVPIKLADNWNQYLSSESSAALRLVTDLSSLNFEVGEKLSSTAAVNLTVHTSRGDYQANPAAQTAETKMLGLKTVVLRYDANGGTGAPEALMVSPQEGYKLDDATVPTHEADGVGPIVFIGWTETQDQHVYLQGETAPTTVTEVDIPEPNLLRPIGTKTVYAVWGYDQNGDGVADVLQVFLTLSYDANGGEGAPEPETKLATTLADGAKFDISSTEPTRAHYTFQGWAKEANATEAKYKYDAKSSGDRDILIHEDTTLYAVWQQNPYYTLYFNANGGSDAPAAQGGYADDVDSSGNAVLKLNISSQTPTRSGYSFLGWSASRNGAAAYQPNDEVQIKGGNVMLYAIWQRSSSGGSSYSGGGGSSTGRTPSPKTGDANNPLLYVILIAASLAAIGLVSFLLLRGRRGRKAKKAAKRPERR